MWRPALLLASACCGFVAGLAATGIELQPRPTYRVENVTDAVAARLGRFTPRQLELLEKLNRADRDHLPRLTDLVVPESWVDDELAYSGLPARYPSSVALEKFLVVHLPGQLFGAYEFGALVRWGPVTTGGRTTPTPSGLFTLNWRSKGHASTINSDWFMPWYFNFNSREGLALHAYAMPGRPDSHGCVRLLDRDARWLFDWGETWSLDAVGTRVLKAGTPVLLLGQYDFEAAPPWRSSTWLAQGVELPSLDLEE